MEEDHYTEVDYIQDLRLALASIETGHSVALTRRSPRPAIIDGTTKFTPITSAVTAHPPESLDNEGDGEQKSGACRT